MNPNGGPLERFVGLELASIGLTFYGATPANDFPTVIYPHEYDVLRLCRHGAEFRLGR